MLWFWTNYLRCHYIVCKGCTVSWLVWALSAMWFSYAFVMSQNKMAMVVWGLCTRNHWERWWFTMIMFIKLKRTEVRYIQCNRIHMSILLFALRIFGLLSCYKSFRIATSFLLFYLMAPCPKRYEQHSLSTLSVEVSFAPHYRSRFC